jgi:hypothetical protein
MPKVTKEQPDRLKPHEKKNPNPVKAGWKPKNSSSSGATPVPAFKSAATKAADRKRLTVGDWLTVFEWWDGHPQATQREVVQEFASRRVGALHFKQSTLSEAVGRRPKMQGLADENSANLSRSRAWVVVCPEVDRALVLWQKHMEEKGELATQVMLQVKRQWFEKAMNIPEDQRLGANNGWVQSFCKMCVMIEYQEELRLIIQQEPDPYNHPSWRSSIGRHGSGCSGPGTHP